MDANALEALDGDFVNQLMEAGGETVNYQPAQTTQIWKINDAAAQKSGPRKTIYASSKTITNQKNNYTGEWHNNMKEGMGTQIYKNGNKYIGMWQQDQRHGKGEYYVKIDSGELVKRYSGEWVNGCRHGRGMLFGKEESLYDGEWANNVRHGEGKQVYPEGDIYEGSWVDGKREGYGRLSKANGDIFEGNWLGDFQEGPGTYYYMARKKRLDGEWAVGVSKCGIMSDFDFDEEANVPAVFGTNKTKHLPVLGLKDPRGVMKNSINCIRNERGAARLANVPVEDMFGEEDLSHMRSAFFVADMDGTGEVKVSELIGCFAELGLELPGETVISLVGQLGKDSDGTVVFDEFCRCVAMFVNMDS